jgi:hypothetical protein
MNCYFPEDICLATGQHELLWPLMQRTGVELRFNIRSKKRYPRWSDCNIKRVWIVVLRLHVFCGLNLTLPTPVLSQNLPPLLTGRLFERITLLRIRDIFSESTKREENFSTKLSSCLCCLWLLDSLSWHLQVSSPQETVAELL